MLKVTVRNNIKFPEIALQEDLEHIAQNIVITDLIKGIDLSAAISGGRLPNNEPETIKRKGSAKPLIETGQLRSSFFYRVKNKSTVVVSIDSGRKEIGGYLQDGIMTKHGLKQYLFFGISKDAFDGAMKYMEKKIKDLTSGKRS